MTILRLALAAGLAGLSLTACSGSDEPEEPDGPEATAPTSAPTSPAPTAEPVRLEVEPGGATVCLDDVGTGDLLAFTGPGISVQGGPATVSDVAFDGGELRIVDSGSVLATLDGVRQPGLTVAGRLDGLDPKGKPYVAGSQGDLVGATFDPGATGFVPLVEVRVAWSVPGVKGVEVSLERPSMTLTYAGEDGAEQTVSVPTPIDLHSRVRGCRPDRP